MEQLARIEARIESLSELGDLVRALRSMAASRVREAQDALAGTRAFCGIVERAIAEVSASAPWPEAATDGDGAVLVLITSQNGFAGGFNERMAELAVAERRPGDRLIVVGRRGEIALAARDADFEHAYPMASRPPGITQLARRIATRLGGVQQARIVHAHHTGGADYEPRLRPVLPLSRPLDGTAHAPPLHHLPFQQLLAAFAAEYLFAEVADALMDSLASENAARLRTMDAASHNIDDRLDRLRRDEHAARQEEMTADMIDIVTGAEAIFTA